MLFYTSDFIIDMLTAHFKLYYWSEKLLKYSVKIVVIVLKGKVQWHFKFQNECNWVMMLWKIIKCVEETNNCCAAQKFDIAKSYVWRWRKQKDIVKGVNSNQKAFHGPKNGTLMSLVKKFWRLSYKKCKKCPSHYQRQYKWRH
jgi:hypothetical protein